ncbi:hypothetical protein IFR05_010182 [Cadophora sp. M221]|nr:hypothetical protein IFR05_010182 [Cadophora sp. M221]
MGFGCIGMSIPRSYGRPNETECHKVLTAAADMDIDFWVTRNAYGPFVNDELISRRFKETGRRKAIFLATKFGINVQDTKPRMLVCSKPDHVKEACARSLERLNVDYIDLYLQQRVDTDIPIEKTIQAMTELKDKEKIRNLSLSECCVRTLERAHKVHPIAAVGMKISPLLSESNPQRLCF